MQTNRYLIALTTALGLIPVVLDTTIVTVALPSIRTALHTDVNMAQWILTGFYLALAAVVAIGGYLANRFGRKRMFLIGIAAFTLGSLLCSISPTIGWLIAFRVFQGIGGGILLPIGPAMAFDAFPQEERARASALVGVPILLAPVFGPILGGYLNDTFVWNSIFFVNLPIGVLAMAAALIVLPRDLPSLTNLVRMDYLGLALSTFGVIVIVYAFSLVTQTNPATVTATNTSGDLYGWGYGVVWVYFGFGVVVLGIFALYALRFSQDPALDLKQYARRDFLMSSIFSWATTLLAFGLLVLLPIYFESVRLPHLTALDTGLALVPLGVGSLIGTIVATACYRTLGPRWVVGIASALTSISAWLLSHTIQPTATGSQLFAMAQAPHMIPSVAGPNALRWELFLVGVSLAMVGIVVQTRALETLKGGALAKASSLFLATRFIFSSIGVAIITTLLVAGSRSRATDLMHQMRTLQQSASANQGTILPGIITAQIPTQAGTWAIQSIFWLIFFGSLGMVVLSLLFPGRLAKGSDGETEAESPVAANAVE